ncbi:MAG: ABC transporter permease [Acidimicrobiales bacterium]|nr:ABC transporter permease [Acidimicrobiales bacterium]RZV42400.1 MAG: hypothetical protein EX269_14900 [Acidimicrobiales bacterium]
MTAVSARRRHPALLVVEHHYRRHKRAWSSIVATGIIGPVLTFIALGFGLGSQIDDTSSLGTEDYLTFVGPGVMAGTAIVQGGMDSLWRTYGMLKWDGTYKTVAFTPSSPAEIAGGHLIFIGLRVAVSSTLYLLVLLLAIGWTGPLALLSPFVAGLTASAMAALIAGYTSRAESEAGFSVLARLVVTPLFVFSGTFVSVETLPVLLGWFIKLTPGYHGIELTRGLVNDSLSLGGGLGHLVVLLAWVGVGAVATSAGFRKTLST